MDFVTLAQSQAKSFLPASSLYAMQSKNTTTGGIFI